MEELHLTAPMLYAMMASPDLRAIAKACKDCQLTSRVR